ncbi:abscisic-aldehyde oxidase-like [Chrysoperla carnea]|uniref:abscisic-aldehyde oxidase-like n=1 Tax=Chrysoperla carnea TaxID=189513 RepID=UPI001D08361C|nr:abscisic-aldehyde oxidase-like [Chrysoperla carnea]
MGSKYSSTFDESKPPIPEVNFCINGKKYTICPDGIKISATTSLNTFIRNVAELKGTKIMCSEGGCGSCIVAAQFIHPLTQREVLIAVNSVRIKLEYFMAKILNRKLFQCLVSVLSCQGWSITTIEGIGNNKKGYNKLQKRLAEFNGSQCGFCSPGMIMNMYCLQKNQKNLTQKDIENSFGGNICRCTGYRSISEAFKSFANDADPTLKAKCTDIENINECFQRHSLCDGCELIDKSQKYLVINLGIEKWFKVYTILELVQIISVIKNMKYMLVAGNTAHGVYRRDPDIKVYVDVNHIAELHDIQINKNVVVGANTTISDAIKLFNGI